MNKMWDIHVSMTMKKLEINAKKSIGLSNTMLNPKVTIHYHFIYIKFKAKYIHCLSQPIEYYPQESGESCVLFIDASTMLYVWVGA
jgi:hypothetical protein